MAKTAKTASKTRTKTFTACPFCGGGITRKYEGLQDRFDTTTRTFSVSECMQCHAGFLNPMPVGDASSFYPTNYLSGEDEEARTSGGFDFERWYRDNQCRFDFGLLARATGISLGKAASYIDIGCGSGERVLFAEAEGCKRSAGLDKFDFKKSATRRGSEFIKSEILDFDPKQKFQVASLFHVLEHIENPEEVLAHIRSKIVQKGGYLIIQVPNYGSMERRFFGRRWFCFDVPRHLWQFNQAAVTGLLEKTGYKVEKTYQVNAPLHPVTIVPSLHRELDIQRIWVKRTHGVGYKRLMTLLWAGLTVLTIPVSLIQNLFKRSSMLTVIASVKT